MGSVWRAVGRVSGFTLIELLVVVSITALLMAILVPSLSRARHQAKGLVCQTHLRELSHGWHMYADENRDVSLPGRYAKEAGGLDNPQNWYDVGNGLKYRPRWVATMGRYVGVYAFDAPELMNDRQDYDSGVYACPAVPRWIDERNYAYGYNHQFLGNARKAGGRFRNFPVNRSQIRNFAATVLGADCLGTAAGFGKRERAPYENDGTGMNQSGNHGWTLDPPRLTATSDRGTGDAGSTRTGVDPRHLGRGNAAYCDGHTESAPVESFGYRVWPDGTYVDLEEVQDRPHNRRFSGTGRDDDPPGLPTA